MLALAPLVAALGCGSTGEERLDGGLDATLDAPAVEPVDAGLDAGPPPTPEERFLDDYEDAWCAYAVRCEQRHDYFRGYEGACHPDVDREETRRARALLARDEIRIDLAAGAACIEALRTAPCSIEPAFEVRSMCRASFPGTRRAGESCTRGEPSVCEPGTECTGESCVLVAGEGESCVEARCDSSLVCTDGVCQQWPTAGMPCPDRRCAAGSVCVDGTCRESRIGAPCAECDPSVHWCDAGTCAEKLPEGNACDPTLFFSCVWGTTCYGEPATCISDDGHDVGDFCYVVTFVEPDSCRDGLICRLDEGDYRAAIGLCVVGGAEGAYCDTASPCAKGLRCADDACARAALPGEPCTSDLACPLGFRCASGTCAPLPAPGQACDTEVGCLAGSCVESVCCLAPEWTPCGDDTTVYGICETWCFSDDMCGPPRECDAACEGQSCWWGRERCAPRCS